MSIKYLVAESSQLFAISGQYPAGTFGRQIVWIWFMILACLTVLVSSSLPRQLAVEKGDKHDELERNVEPDERTALLR
jgi:hypothetical protein